MIDEQLSIDEFNKQVSDLVRENRRLRAKSDADDETILTLKKQYDDLAAGVESMVEDHKAIEAESQERFNKANRELMFERDRAVRAYKEIEGLLMQAGNAAMSMNDLIMQAARAKIGDSTPEKMPEVKLPDIKDSRLPAPTIDATK